MPRIRSFPCDFHRPQKCIEWKSSRPVLLFSFCFIIIAMNVAGLKFLSTSFLYSYMHLSLRLSQHILISFLYNFFSRRSKQMLEISHLLTGKIENGLTLLIFSNMAYSMVYGPANTNF